MARICRNCGGRVPPNSLTCPHCYQELHREVSDGSRVEKQKDPRTALLLAVIPGLIGIWGLGHIYMGATDRGLYFLATGIIMTLSLLGLAYGWFLIFTIVCLVMASILWLSLFAFQVFEAWVLANAGIGIRSVDFGFR